MRHLKHRNQLGVKKEHRLALTANLAAALIKEGRITTTLKKAKALRPFAEKLVTLAKKGTLHHRRIAVARLRDRDAVQVLFDERASDFAQRNGGYTRIYKIGTRIGDAAEMAIIEWVGPEEEGYKKTRRKSAKDKATPAAAAAAAAGEQAAGETKGQGADQAEAAGETDVAETQTVEPETPAADEETSETEKKKEDQ